VISTTTTNLGMSIGKLRQKQHLEKKEGKGIEQDTRNRENEIKFNQLEQELVKLRGEKNLVITQLEEEIRRLKSHVEEPKTNGVAHGDIDIEKLKQKISRQKEKYNTVRTELNFKVTLVDGLQSTITQMQELNHLNLNFL